MNTEINYVDYLKNEINQRKQKNFRYSERAFARDLGISPGFLNLLLSGKKSLSAERGLELAKKLSWSELKTLKFVGMIEGNESTLKNSAKKSKTPNTMIEAEFEEISDWYYFAIVELTDLIESADPAVFAKELNISKLEADFAIKKLLRLGVICESKKGFVKAKPDYGISEKNLESIKKFHRQCLEKAILALRDQSLEEREFNSLTLSFDSTRTLEAKKMIREFIYNFDRRFLSGTKDSVYQMNVNLIKLNKVKGKKK